MKKIFGAFLIFFLLLHSTLVSSEPPKTYFAYIGEGMSQLSYNDVRLAYSFLIKKYGKKFGYDIDIYFDRETDENIKLFQKHELDYLGLTACTFAKHSKELLPYIDISYISSSSEELLSSYVILASTSLHNLTLDKIAGRKLILQDSECNALMYANEIAQEQFGKSAQETFDISYTPSRNQAVLKLFFGKADLAIVPLRSWKTAKEMNPSIVKKVAILKTSPKQFTFGVEIYHKDISQESKKLFKKSNSMLESSEEGKQILRIMKVAKHERVEPTRLQELLKYYFEYNKKYKTEEVLP